MFNIFKKSYSNLKDDLELVKAKMLIREEIMKASPFPKYILEEYEDLIERRIKLERLVMEILK